MQYNNKAKTLILALLSFLAAVSINFLEKKIYPLRLEEEVKMVPQKEIVNFLCLDHRGFAADLFFIKVNLHSGSLMWKPLKFQFDSKWSYATMALITDLDPKYYTAYLFSAMGLIHNFDDVYLVRPILEKGMKIFPQSWELPFWLGYDFYIYQEDYKTAGKYLWLASQKQGAPKTYLSLFLSVFRKGGSYEKALWTLQAIMDKTEDERLKKIYGKKFAQLQNLAFLQNSVKKYREKNGHFPAGLNALVKEKIIKKMPEDPMGMHYRWDKEKKRVVVR